MRFELVVISIISIILISGCVQQEKPITNITIGNVEYSFSNDIREAMKVPVANRSSIQELALLSQEIHIVFDCSVAEEKPSISVSAFNVVSIIQNYLVAHGSFTHFDTYCFQGEKWYNSTDNEAQKPAGTILWFKGPKTGANGTSVYVENTTITIEGTDHKNMTLAADAFSLAVLGYQG